MNTQNEQKRTVKKPNENAVPGSKKSSCCGPSCCGNSDEKKNTERKEK